MAQQEDQLGELRIMLQKVIDMIDSLTEEETGGDRRRQEELMINSSLIS